MKVLIFGIGGMLGHKLAAVLSRTYEIIGTTHIRSIPSGVCSLGARVRDIPGIDVSNTDVIRSVLMTERPQVVVNCVGVIKQLKSADDPLTCIKINALFPHVAATICGEVGARFIHVSTDCVFSGRKGQYTESDIPDPVDLYGRSKLLGELQDSEGLTLRTSIVGPEVGTSHGLFEWFLTNTDPQVRGFTNAIFSGLTTLELSRVVASVIQGGPHLSGVYQVSADSISKYDLLMLLKDAFAIKKEVRPVPLPIIDRSLDSSKFKQATGYSAPPWQIMVRELAEDMRASKVCG